MLHGNSIRADGHFRYFEPVLVLLLKFVVFNMESMNIYLFESALGNFCWIIVVRFDIILLFCFGVIQPTASISWRMAVSEASRAVISG